MSGDERSTRLVEKASASSLASDVADAGTSLAGPSNGAEGVVEVVRGHSVPAVETGADPEQVAMLEGQLTSARQELRTIAAENDTLKITVTKLESALAGLRLHLTKVKPIGGPPRVNLTRIRKNKVVKGLAAKKRKTKKKGKKKSRKR